MSIKVRTNSRFAISDPIVTRDGEPTFGIAKKFRFLDRSNLGESDIKTVIVNADQAGKWDILARDIYGNVDLKWIFIIFNAIENPFGGIPRVGQVVEYPSPTVVFAEL
jgi:hypothetical protein